MITAVNCGLSQQLTRLLVYLSTRLLVYSSTTNMRDLTQQSKEIY